MKPDREHYAEPGPAVWLVELRSWGFIGVAVWFAVAIRFGLIAAFVVLI